VEKNPRKKFMTKLQRHEKELNYCIFFGTVSMHCIHLKTLQHQIFFTQLTGSYWQLFIQ
jgi:hypothetical protein